MAAKKKIDDSGTFEIRMNGKAFATMNSRSMAENYVKMQTESRRGLGKNAAKTFAANQNWTVVQVD